MFISVCIGFLFVFVMAVVIVKDATSMTIPNWLSLLMIGGFVLTTPFVWESWPVLSEQLLCALSMLLLGFTLFAFGLLGGGDAKLMAATSLFWVFEDLLQYLLLTTVLGAILGIFLLIARRFIPVGVIGVPWLGDLIENEKNMPYGLALAGGALLTLPHSEIFSRAMGF